MTARVRATFHSMSSRSTSPPRAGAAIRSAVALPRAMTVRLPAMRETALAQPGIASVGAAWAGTGSRWWSTGRPQAIRPSGNWTWTAPGTGTW